MIKRPRIFYNGSIYRVVIIGIRCDAVCNKCSLDSSCNKRNWNDRPICVDISEKFELDNDDLILVLDHKSTILDCDYVKSSEEYKDSIPVVSYEAALIKLDRISPKYLGKMPANEQAYHKLCTIAEALNVEHTKEDRIYYPWWWTEDLRAGVASRYSINDLACADSPIGFRLCCFDQKTALYLGSEPFAKLWKNYLL